jgi:hypothetical protein
MPIPNPKKGASDAQSETFPGARRDLWRASRWGRRGGGSERIDVDDEVRDADRDRDPAVEDEHDPGDGSAPPRPELSKHGIGLYVRPAGSRWNRAGLLTRRVKRRHL